MEYMIPDNPDALIERAVTETVKAVGYVPARTALGDPEMRLTRRDTAMALRKAGFPIAEKTLATKATRGGGPSYSMFSGRALYRWGDALAWARGCLAPPRRTVPEADAQGATGLRGDDASADVGLDAARGRARLARRG